MFYPPPLRTIIPSFTTHLPHLCIANTESKDVYVLLNELPVLSKDYLLFLLCVLFYLHDLLTTTFIYLLVISQEMEYCSIDTPILTSNDCEGAGELFQVEVSKCSNL